MTVMALLTVMIQIAKAILLVLKAIAQTVLIMTTMAWLIVMIPIAKTMRLALQVKSLNQCTELASVVTVYVMTEALIQLRHL